MTAVKKIEKLTPKQEKALPLFHDKWLKIGTSTLPADKPRAEAAITAMYQLMGKEKPMFIWAASPMTAELLINILSDEKLGKELQSSLRSSLQSSLQSSLGSSLGSSLWSSLGSSLQSSKLKYTGAWFWGSQDAYWIAFYLFCEEIGVKYSEKDSKLLKLWAEISQSCTWWYPYDKTVIICDRPSEVHFSGKKLHREGGMAVKFRDGWGIYQLNGITVPAWITETPAADLDVKKIMAETNVDIRREGLRRVPLTRILESVNAKELDRSIDPKRGPHHDYTLYDTDFGDGKKRVLLRMFDKGSNAYCIERVEDDCKTVSQALAWRDDEETYRESSIVT